MIIYNGNRYLNELLKILKQINIIKHPKTINKLIKKGIVHKNKDGEIVGWIIKGEIRFWSEDYLDVDEYAQKLNYNEYVTIENCSYHFNPYSEELKCFRIDKIGENIHANSYIENELNKHISPEEIKLEIKKLNLIICIYIAMKYISNPDKYPLLDKFSEIYNAIINGEGGKY